MARTPGFIVPSSGTPREETIRNIRRAGEAAGYTPFVPSEFSDAETDRESMMHFGVKGMKWGVIRRNRPPASADTVKVRESMHKVKKGGTQALTTKELQELVNRMNLEQQYSKLTVSKKKSRFENGHGFVKSTLAVGRTMNEVMQFLNSPFGKFMRNGFGKK